MVQDPTRILYRGAIWPDLRLIAGYDLQIHYGCDPVILQLFHSRFIVNDEPKGNVILASATKAQWAHYALDWSKRERMNRKVKEVPGVTH